MANWTKTFTQAENINSGQEFTLNDVPTTQMVNAPINNTQYLYDELVTKGNYKIDWDNSKNNGRIAYVSPDDNYKKIHYSTSGILLDADGGIIQAVEIQVSNEITSPYATFTSLNFTNATGDNVNVTDTITTDKLKSWGGYNTYPLFVHRVHITNAESPNPTDDRYISIYLDMTMSYDDEEYSNMSDLASSTWFDAYQQIAHFYGTARVGNQTKIVAYGSIISSTKIILFMTDGSSLEIDEMSFDYDAEFVVEDHVFDY